MLVDVVRLRERGVKRPREDVLTTTPLRGKLRLTSGRPGWHAGQRNAPLLAGIVERGRTEWAIPPLDHARVIRIEGSQMIVIGDEEIREGRTTSVYRQAWWCRLVDAPAALPSTVALPQPSHKPKAPAI